MKKVLALLIGFAVCFTVFSAPLAETSERMEGTELTKEFELIPGAGTGETRYIETYADGGYAEIAIVTSDSPSYTSAGTMSVSSMAYYKNGSKVYRRYNSSGSMIYSFTVSAVFYIQPGISATCTSSSYSRTINDSTWSLSSASTYRTGNSAVGNAKFVKKILFVVIETNYIELILRCDSYGNMW